MCWRSGWHASATGSTWSPSSALIILTSSCLWKEKDTSKLKKRGRQWWKTPLIIERSELSKHFILKDDFVCCYTKMSIKRDDDAHLLVANYRCVLLHLFIDDWVVFRCSSPPQTEKVQCTHGTGAKGSQWVLGDKTTVLPQVRLWYPCLSISDVDRFTSFYSTYHSLWRVCIDFTFLYHTTT